MSQKKKEHSTRAAEIDQYFSAEAEVWNDLYVNPRTANDLVLIDRLAYSIGLLGDFLPPPASVLDVGCGAGLEPLRLIESGYFVTAVDISQRMMNLCQDTISKGNVAASSYRLINGDFMELDLGAESFDGVVALGFLEYQPDELSALKRFSQLLRPRGILILSGPIRFAAAKLFGLLDVIAAMRDVRHPSMHRYSLTRMRSLLSAAGFQLVGHARHGFAGFPHLERLAGFSAGALVHSSLSALSRSLPIKACSNNIVVAAIKTQP